MRRSTRFLLVPWLLMLAAFAACNAITGASDLKVGDAAGGAGEGAAGEGAGGEGAAGEGSSGRGSGGRGAGEACGGSPNDCDACCAERAGLSFIDTRNYFEDCFCDPLKEGGDGDGDGDLCDAAPDGTCASCCQELCESGGVRPSDNQVSRCSQCAADESAGNLGCRSQFAHYCAGGFTFGCDRYAACVYDECTGRLRRVRRTRAPR